MGVDPIIISYIAEVLTGDIRGTFHSEAHVSGLFQGVSRSGERSSMEWEASK